MQLIEMLMGVPWVPLPGRVIRHSMDEGPRISENWHEAIRNANREKVIAALRSGCDCVKSIADHAGMDYTTAKSHLDKLIAMNLVTMTEAKVMKGRKRIYGIVK